jgi:hypothetical protein
VTLLEPKGKQLAQRPYPEDLREAKPPFEEVTPETGE